MMWKIQQAMQDDAIPDARIHPAVHSGNRDEVFIWQNFQPAYRDLGWKNRDLGNRASPPSHEHIENFTKDLEVRRDLGNRASQVKRAHMKRPLVIQRHNEIRDLQAELIDMVCYDVQVEPALQPITGEELARGTNQPSDARLDVHCRGIWERRMAAFFDIRLCHPNADSYRDLSPKQIYRIHENEKKRKYNSRVTEIEQGTFTPLVFTTTGGMADECLRYHSRLAELLSAKKQESYAPTISWVWAKVALAERAPMPKGIENPEKEEEFYFFKTVERNF